MFLLLATGVLQAISAFGLLFIPRGSSIIGAITLIIEAAFCVAYLPVWWLIAGFIGVALVVYLRFGRQSTLLSA